MNISLEQRDFLKQHRGMNNQFVQSGVIAHLSNLDGRQFYEIAKLFNPDYPSNLWCGDCVMNMVQYVYTQIDKQLALETQNTEESGTIAMSFPLQVPEVKEKKPRKTKANGKA